MNLNVTKILILGEEIYQIFYLHKMEFSLNGGIALVVLFRVKSVYFLKFSHSGGCRCSKVGVSKVYRTLGSVPCIHKVRYDVTCL